MIIDHKELGYVELKTNNRAKRIIVRYSDGMFKLTHPRGVKLTEVEAALDKMAPKLLSLKNKVRDKLMFTPDSEFKTYSFSVKIIENTNLQFYMSLKNEVLYIACPKGANIEDSQLQSRIRNGIEQVLRIEAKRLFPEWVKRIAGEYKFTYLDVKINKSQSRWGSCSSKKSINLSYYCLLLPHHLIELIVLHELCHTIEMNHSEKFWSLLNNVTNGKAKQLTTELKQYRTSF